MLRLLKLAAYSLLGYALYEFVRGATSGDVKGSFQSVRDKIEGGAGNLGRRARHMVEAASDQLSEQANEGGQGNGRRQQGSQREATLDPDGGSVTHTVGRGVVS